MLDYKFLFNYPRFYEVMLLSSMTRLRKSLIALLIRLIVVCGK